LYGFAAWVRSKRPLKELGLAEEEQAWAAVEALSQHAPPPWKNSKSLSVSPGTTLMMMKKRKREKMTKEEEEEEEV
jgi:hypothetical protein